MNTSGEAARRLARSRVEISFAASPFANFLARREGKNGGSVAKYRSLANPASYAG